MHRALRRSYAGGAVSYGRGSPVPRCFVCPNDGLRPLVATSDLSGGARRPAGQLRNFILPGLYIRHMPRALRWSYGEGDLKDPTVGLCLGPYGGLMGGGGTFS